MSSLTVPTNNKLFPVKAEYSQQFIKELNKNKVTSEFLEECRKVSELFEKDE